MRVRKNVKSFKNLFKWQGNTWIKNRWEKDEELSKNRWFKKEYYTYSEFVLYLKKNFDPLKPFSFGMGTKRESIILYKK